MNKQMYKHLTNWVNKDIFWKPKDVQYEIKQGSTHSFPKPPYTSFKNVPELEVIHMYITGAKLFQYYLERRREINESKKGKKSTKRN